MERGGTIEIFFHKRVWIFENMKETDGIQGKDRKGKGKRRGMGEVESTDMDYEK